MILGIDPGLKGALAVYERLSNRIVSAHSIPTYVLKRNGKNKNAVNIHGLLILTREIVTKFPKVTAFLELVNAMPGQGVSSVFSFGRTDGCIDTAVCAAGIPYTKVAPQTWKKTLSVPADKDGALLRAGQLMPESVGEWTPVRNVRDKELCIGIAEAALIAFYGAKINT